MFITFEGPDGGGKTTQIKLLSPFLVSKGFQVVCTREPGGTEIGDQVRDVLMNMKNREMCPRAEILLFCASRAQLVTQLVRPALSEGKIVICDRFTDSTMAYQGFGHGLDKTDLRSLLEFATGGLKPDLTILLDISSEEGLKRRQTNHEEWNRMDDYALNFHKRVREGYLELAASDPARFFRVDAAQSRESVQKEIRAEILRRLQVSASRA